MTAVTSSYYRGIFSEDGYACVVDKDRMSDDWFLTRSPYPVVAAIIVYLLVIFKIGPKFMEKRPPYDLSNIMRVYNVFQVLYNFLILYGVLSHSRAFSVTIFKSCSLLEGDSYEDIKIGYQYFFWAFLLIKLVDLLDTIFMVLRKKHSHVSFLHVYHHVSTVFFVWFSDYYIKSLHGILPGLLNVFVHMVMYSYYFLATFPPLKKYLWWKRYLTKLQLGQFVVILAYITLLNVFGCPISRNFTYIWLVNVTVVMVLFINFYIQAYVVKRNQDSKKNS